MFKQVCQDVMKLILQFLDLKSLLATARCNKQLRHDANSKTAFKKLPKFIIHSNNVTEVPQVLMLWHPKLCYTGNHVSFLKLPITLHQVVRELDFCGKDISNDDCIAILKAIHENKSLISLNFYWNSIEKEGGIAIAEFIRENKSLTYLNLETNEIGNDGCIAIAEAMKVNTTLTSLSLSDNQIMGECGVVELIRKNNTLLSLFFHWNNISDDERIAIVEAMKDNKSLTILDVRDHSWNIYYSGNKDQSAAEIIKRIIG